MAETVIFNADDDIFSPVEGDEGSSEAVITENEEPPGVDSKGTEDEVVIETEDSDRNVSPPDDRVS